MIDQWEFLHYSVLSYTCLSMTIILFFCWTWMCYWHRKGAIFLKSLFGTNNFSCCGLKGLFETLRRQVVQIKASRFRVTHFLTKSVILKLGCQINRIFLMRKKFTTRYQLNTNNYEESESFLKIRSVFFFKSYKLRLLSAWFWLIVLYVKRYLVSSVMFTLPLYRTLLEILTRKTMVC